MQAHPFTQLNEFQLATETVQAMLFAYKYRNWWDSNVAKRIWFFIYGIIPCLGTRIFWS